MTIYKPYNRWNTGTTERLAAPPSPMSRQCPPHLDHVPEPTEQLDNEETPEMRVLRVFLSTARSRCVYPGTTASTAVQHPSPAPCTICTSQNDAKRRNKRDMPETHPFRTFHLVAPTQHVDLQETMTTTPQHPSQVPISLETQLKAGKKFNFRDFCHIWRLSMFCHRASGN
jgi:hypothetical protein